MTLSRFLQRALLAVLALPLSAVAALATEASATTALNVRSGPSTAYSVVDTLTPGEVVDVTECQANGWCYINHPGPDGWVSSSYLTAGPSAGSPGSDCRFQLTLGAGGPQFTIVCGDGSFPAPSPSPTPSGNQACFYDLPNFSGASFCRDVGIYNTLAPVANNRITSVQLYGSARVRLCENPNMGGYCRLVNSNVALLGPLINNRTSSLRVFVGTLPPPPPPAPVTYSTGPVNLPLGNRANLDNGSVGPGGADIWYRQVSPGNRRLVPVNGARMARGDGTNRGLAGCSSKSYSPAALPLAALSVGTYVCVRTSQGRISQFRVNSYGPAVMRIGYTTWAN